MIFWLLLILVESINYSRASSVPRGEQAEWYSVEYLDNARGWMDLRGVRLTKSEVLSNRYMSSAKRTLRHFQFPFYREKLYEVAITTQGFLNMGTSNHVQSNYIAPLMANFKPYPVDKPSQDIRDYQSKEMLVVQWSEMILEGAEDAGGVKTFTFQVQLYYTGVIQLLYREIPISPIKINNSSHPVRVGMSGVYSTGEEESYLEEEAYNTIHVDFNKIRSNTTVVISPVPTCLDQLSCYDCVLFSTSCLWCDVLQRCSDERQIQPTWDRVGCNLNSTRQCFSTTPTAPYTEATTEARNTSNNGTDRPRVILSDKRHNSTGVGADVTRDNYNITKTGPKEKKSSLSLIYVILIITAILSSIFIIAALVILKMYPKDHHVLQQTDNFSTAVQI